MLEHLEHEIYRSIVTEIPESAILVIPAFRHLSRKRTFGHMNLSTQMHEKSVSITFSSIYTYRRIYFIHFARRLSRFLFLVLDFHHKKITQTHEQSYTNRNLILILELPSN